MKTPYQILAVSADADDAQIKQAYLHQVKNYPPDRDPENFRRIKQAYEAIKDHHSRLRYELFSLPEADFDALLDQALETAADIRIDPEKLRKLLDAGLDDASLLNTLTDNDQS
ncbi:DnaJ domain-containing protein [Methylomarinum sp. Ch1-1]|uniref:DnaJ domain-containing protein n=1 Tax=Methylomarinum roseum TaxID=3067653 RepID=A0AAU7NQL3_9GAMM|nr:DnaJ domain-containing protein [Methylomarinum sp. Ch1-1]MDP4520817.1 DnaJ domain-containing protein [Methylomarinum sp. Ch1-1]